MTISEMPHESDAVRFVDVERLRSLLDVVRVLSSTLELRAVFQVAIEGACDLMDLHTGAIYLLDDDRLYLGATTPPLPEDFPEHLRYAHLSDHPRIAEALLTRSFVTLDDSRGAELTQAEREVCELRDLRTVLYVPLLVQRRALGAFIVGSCGETRRIPESDVSLCAALAYSIALAVDNARLFESVRTSAAELAAAYDAELVRRERLRALAVALSDAESDQSAQLIGVIRSRIDPPLRDLREHLLRARTAWRIPEDDPSFIRAVEIVTSVQEAANAIADELAVPVLGDQGFGPALMNLCQRALGGRIPCHVDVAADVIPTGSPIDRFLVQAASELLHATAAHTSSTSVSVSLSMRGDDFILTVEDDDRSWAPTLGSPADPRSTGLFSLSERCAHLGGRLEVAAGESGGTLVHLAVPAKEWVLGPR